LLVEIPEEAGLILSEAVAAVKTTESSGKKAWEAACPWEVACPTGALSGRSASLDPFLVDVLRHA
jgi:hypothetical protein